jgi:hypothetical protein
MVQPLSSSKNCDESDYESDSDSCRSAGTREDYDTDSCYSDASSDCDEPEPCSTPKCEPEPSCQRTDKAKCHRDACKRSKVPNHMQDDFYTGTYKDCKIVLNVIAEFTTSAQPKPSETTSYISEDKMKHDVLAILVEKYPDMSASELCKMLKNGCIKLSVECGKVLSKINRRKTPVFFDVRGFAKKDVTNQSAGTVWCDGNMVIADCCEQILTPVAPTCDLEQNLTFSSITDEMLETGMVGHKAEMNGADVVYHLYSGSKLYDHVVENCETYGLKRHQITNSKLRVANKDAYTIPVEAAHRISCAVKEGRNRVNTYMMDTHGKGGLKVTMKPAQAYKMKPQWGDDGCKEGTTVHSFIKLQITLNAHLNE